MADQQWIQEMADVVDVAEQQALQHQAQREQQDEVAIQPATTPRNLESRSSSSRTASCPAVAGVQQSPPPPRAQRPDYESRREEQWSQPPTYYFNYDSTRTGTDYHQEMEQARHAHLEAAARLEDQWDKQRHGAAEREWLKASNMKQPLNVGKLKCVRQDTFQHIGFQQDHLQWIQTEAEAAEPRSLPQVHAALLQSNDPKAAPRSNDPEAPQSQPVVAKKPPDLFQKVFIEEMHHHR